MPADVAVTGGYAYSPVTVDGSDFEMAQVNLSTKAVSFFGGYSGMGNAITTDGSYLYVAATAPVNGGWGGGIYKISLASGNAETLPWTYSSRAYGIALANGKIYVDAGDNTIQQVDPSTWTSTTLVSGLGSYGRVTADSQYLYIADLHNIDRYNLSTSSLTSAWATLPASVTALDEMGGYLYSSTYEQLVRFDPSAGSSSQRYIAGSSNAGNADGTGLDAQFAGAAGVSGDGTNLWISDRVNDNLREASPGSALPASQSPAIAEDLAMNPGMVSTFAGVGNGTPTGTVGRLASVTNPDGITIVANKAYTVVKVDNNDSQIEQIDLSSGATSYFGQFSGGGFGITSDGSYLYVAGDYLSTTWIGQLVAISLSPNHSVAQALTYPSQLYGITYGPDGNLYLLGADGTVEKTTPWSWITSTLVSGLTGSQYQYEPIAADATGLWIADGADLDRYSFSTASLTKDWATITTRSIGATGIAVAGRYLYVADYDATVIRYDTTVGSSSAVVVAGSGQFGYSDAVGTAAQFYLAWGLASDGSSVWMADHANNYLRRVTPGAAGPALTAAEQKGSHPAEKTATCSCADPVNTSTGNFTESYTDLSVPGRGPALGLVRAYNSDPSSSSVDGAFGYGWSFTYGMNLSIGSNTVTVNQEDGSQVAFNLSGSTWAPAAPRVLARLVHNGDGTWTFTRRAREIFLFSATGQLSALKDLNGYQTAITHPTGQLVATEPAGRTLTFGYTGGHVTSVADSSSPARTVSYSYDGNGNLTDVIDVGGGHWQFGYDSSHRLTTIRAPKYYGDTTTTPTPVVTNAYDASGRVNSQTDQLGRTTSFDYTSIPGATKVTDAKGNVTVDYYTNGVLSSVTKGYGTSSSATSSYWYDPATLALAQVSDPNGHVTNYYDDAAGNVLSVIDALGRVTTKTYDSINDLTSATDPAGVTTTYTYDTAGNLKSVSTPLVGSSPAQSRVTTYTYGDSTHPNDVTATTDPDGKVWSYAYDAYGDRTSVTAPATPENAAGNKTTYAYNTATGWLASTVSPKGNVTGGLPSQFTTAYTYNAYGDPLTVTDPNGHVTTYTYDANRNKASVKDANNNTTAYTYDPANELTKVTRPDTTTLVYTYDAAGNKASYIDGANHTTSYGYDPLNRQTSATDALNRTTSYTYDGAGNRTAVQDPGGNCSASPKVSCVTYAYDAANELSGITYSDGTTPNVSALAYDADGRRTSMTDGTGTSTWAWDSLGRMTSSKDGAGNTVSYSYDLAGNKTGVTYPGSKAVSYTYDAAGRMASVGDWLSNTTSFGYDANSNLVSETLPSSTTVADTFSYDNADQLTGITDTAGTVPFASFSYTRDGNNQLTGDTSVGLSQTPQTYGYDSLNRLSTLNVASSYGYDSADNLTKLASGPSQAFDAANQLCWVSPTGLTGTCASPPTGATTFAYDTRGDRTSSTPSGGSATTYGYDLADRLTAYGPSATYKYNGDGLRVSKTVSGTAEAFVWDVSGSMPLVGQDGTTSFVYGPGGLPLEQISSTGTVTWIHHDQLGSTRVLTNSAGSVVGTATYDPYGKVTTTSGSTAPLGYASQYTDAESGLIYMRNRYYDPATGQFLTDDPLVAVTLAPYRYVSDDPVNVTDPDGLGFCLLGHNPDGSCRGSGLAKDYEAGGGLHASAKILGYESAGIAAVASGGALAVTDAATIEALSFGADAATGVSIAANGAAVADDLATHACSRTTGADVLSTVFGLAAIPVGAFVGSVATGLRPFISPISRGTAQLIGKFTSGIALGTGDWISGSLSNGG